MGKHETAGGRCGCIERPCTTCTGGTTGDVVGSIVSTCRPTLTTDVGVALVGTVIVSRGAIILTLQDSESISSTFADGFVLQSWQERRGLRTYC